MGNIRQTTEKTVSVTFAVGESEFIIVHFTLE